MFAHVKARLQIVVLTAPVKGHHNTGYLKACFGKKKGIFKEI